MRGVCPAVLPKRVMKYIPEVDGLRGIAILAVMAFHLGLPGFQYGYLGVDLFFILSGYLITSILLNEQKRNSHVDLRKFYIRRALRLLPALTALLVVIVITAPLIETRDGAART